MERYVRRVLSRTTGRQASLEEAADIVQEFLGACVKGQWLSRADPTKGRFRAYLQTLLRRYTYRVLKRGAAQKRSPGPGRQVYELLEEEDRRALTPEEQAELDDFARGWVKIAVDQALARLAEENERYKVVILDLIQTDGEGSDDLALRVDVRHGQLPVLKHRARKRFCAIFEEELAQTVGDQEAFEEEWKAVTAFLPPGY
jgi:DNA-directed RNA polymerase specialized sigma24 family protein